MKPEAMTPGIQPRKASDLVSNMNSENQLALPRIQSSRSNQMSQPSLMHRQLSRQKMLDIQRSGAGAVGNDNSTQASQQSKRSRQLYMANPLAEQHKNSN